MGWVASTLLDPIPLKLFLSSGFKGGTLSDILPPTFKTAIFGLIIGAVSCFQGMRTSGGTKGVGRSATSSVVLASLFIMLTDIVLVRLIIEVF
jgi:phospholipid/cholesterol/gamma-HCH transport system permease protein